MVDWVEAVDDAGELTVVVTSIECNLLEPVERLEVTGVIGL
jgi:hypothetical protein